jgi:CRISPR system Cascade subunit CasE
MTLHLFKLQPDMPRLVRWAAEHRLLPRRGDDDLGYALHAVLAAAFGEFAPKPFALQRDANRPAALLAYSEHAPDVLRDHAAAFAEPDTAAALGLDSLAAKAMPERFAAARRLGFALRARPTVRTDRDSDRDSVREVDAFLAAVEGTAPGAGPDRGAVYGAWLAQRLAAGGVEPERLTLDSFRLSDVQRRGQGRTLRMQRGPDACFTGVLRVVDPDAFALLLARGVGRHRAFGYGMLLLRPA